MKSIYAVLLLAAISCGDARTADPVATSVTGKGAQALRTYDFKAFEPYLNRENDSVYVVNFWATWCAPCVKELPHFKNASEKYKDQKVRILLVSLDMRKEVEPTLMPFVEKNGIGHLAVHLHEPDADSWIPKVSPQWSGALPATLIYSAKKRKFYERSFSAPGLENEINSFLN